MVGSTDESGTASPSLRRLIDETSDLIDSPSFSHVLTLLLDEGFGLLVDNKIAAMAYKMPPTSASTARVQEIVGTDGKAKLANTLAVFCRQAHAIGSGSTNEYLTAMEAVRDLEAFAAVVYSSNFEFEAPEPGVAPAPVSEPPSSWRGTSAAPTPAGAGRAVDSEDALPPGVEGVPTLAETSLAESSDFERAWAKVQKEEAKK
jgi:peroxin-3